MIADTWGHGVMRWHASTSRALQRSGDTTDAHSARMARMALWLWPDTSRELLAAIVCHDVAEGGPGGTGDVPGPCKVGALGAAMAKRTADIELARGTCRWLWHLDADDQRRLCFLDRLDAIRWAQLCEPRALSGDGWPEARARLLRDAERLGVLPQVEGVLS